MKEICVCKLCFSTKYSTKRLNLNKYLKFLILIATKGNNMGLTAVCNEGELIVSYNGKVLQKYFLEDWLEVKEAELLYSGADYLE